MAPRPSTVRYPPQTTELHHEVELYVAIGSAGRRLDEQGAAASILGYGLAVDLTRRDVQARAKERGRPWALSKGFDQAAPLSELRLGLPSPQCELELWVGGEERQRGHIGQMTLSPIEVLIELSEQVAIEPGDIILTGTPAGVGPVQVGDEVRARLGTEVELRFTLI